MNDQEGVDEKTIANANAFTNLEKINEKNFSIQVLAKIVTKDQSVPYSKRLKNIKDMADKNNQEELKKRLTLVENILLARLQIIKTLNNDVKKIEELDTQIANVCFADSEFERQAYQNLSWEEYLDEYEKIYTKLDNYKVSTEIATAIQKAKSQYT